MSQQRRGHRTRIRRKTEDVMEEQSKDVAQMVGGESPALSTYILSEDMQIRLESDFTYHSPKKDQSERYVLLRQGAFHLARHICMMTPPSREQSLALTHLETAIFFANAAIARHES